MQGSPNYGPRNHFVNDEKNMFTKILLIWWDVTHPEKSQYVRRPPLCSVIAYVALGKKFGSPCFNTSLAK